MSLRSNKHTECSARSPKFAEMDGEGQSRTESMWDRRSLRHIIGLSIFDFDWSLVYENAFCKLGAFILSAIFSKPEELAGGKNYYFELLEESYYSICFEPMGIFWTKCMDLNYIVKLNTFCRKTCISFRNSCSW